MSDIKYQRVMDSAEKDRMRKHIAEGGLGSYIHYNRANYIKYGIGFDEIDIATRNVINFEDAHKAAKDRLHEFQELSRMKADIKVARTYNIFYDVLDIDTSINDPNYKIPKKVEEGFYDVMAKIVQKAINTELDADGKLKYKKISVNDVKKIMYHKDLEIKLPSELKKFFKKHSYLFEKDSAGRYKKISKKNMQLFKNEVKELIDFIEEITKNGKINEENSKKIQGYLSSDEAKNYRKAINFLIKAYTETLDIPWDVVIAVDEKFSAALAMCMGKGLNEIEKTVFIKNMAKHVNKSSSAANQLLKVQINDYGAMVDRRHMLEGITTAERKNNNTHHMIGFNTKHINNDTIIRREYGLWKVVGDEDGIGSVEFNTGTKGTTDAYVEYEMLPNEIKEIYNEFNILIEGVGISEKKYSGLVTLVDKTNFDTALNSAPVSFLNHYYNLVASKRDNVGFKKDPSISPNSGVLDTNLALANQTIKCYIVLRALAGIRTRGDTSKNQTDFLMVTDTSTGKKTVYSIRRILSIIEMNIDALEASLKITNLPKDSVKNVWMGNYPSLEGAKRRITRLMAALHTRKVTVKLNINNPMFNGAKG